MHSSEGYSVRLMGRNRLQYRDVLGELKVAAEAMSAPWSSIVVDSSSIPDRPGVPGTEVISRHQRAFDYAGWTWIDSDDDDPGDR